MAQFLNLLDASLEEVRAQAPGERVVVAPTHIAAAAEAAFVASVAGYPTGRHHTLIKASEARLAVQFGAAEVWVAVDATLGDATSLLSDLVTVREACPLPARLGLIVPEGENAKTACEAAAQAGYQCLVVPEGGDPEVAGDTALAVICLAAPNPHQH